MAQNDNQIGHLTSHTGSTQPTNAASERGRARATPQACNGSRWGAPWPP